MVLFTVALQISDLYIGELENLCICKNNVNFKKEFLIKKNGGGGGCLSCARDIRQPNW